MVVAVVVMAAVFVYVWGGGSEMEWGQGGRVHLITREGRRRRQEEADIHRKLWSLPSYSIATCSLSLCACVVSVV